jgi:hypothetical protein
MRGAGAEAADDCAFDRRFAWRLRNASSDTGDLAMDDAPAFATSNQGLTLVSSPSFFSPAHLSFSVFEV